MSTQTPFDNVLGDQRAITLVKTRYTVAEKAQSKQMSNFDKWFRMYKNEKVRQNYKGTSNITVPKAFEKVERGTALISQSIKRIQVIGQGPTDTENAKNNEQLIDFENRILGLPRLIKQYIKTARIHGLGWIKATWDVSKEEPLKPYKGLQVSLPDPRSIYINPDWTPDQPIRWCIHEVDIPVSELTGITGEKLTKIKATSSLGKNTTTRGKTYGGKKSEIDTSDTTTLMCNLKEYWGPYSKTEGGVEKPYKILIANDSVEVECNPNPYSAILEDPIPIIPACTYIVPHEMFPMGDVQAIEELVIELNDMRNQRMDTVILNIDPAKVVLKAAQIDEADLVAKKGWVIKSNVPNGIQFLPPDMQGVVASINEEKIIQGDIDRTLGMPSFGASTPVSGDITTDTATGVNATLQAQDIVSNSVLEEFKYSLTKFYRLILAYNQAFIDRAFMVTITEKDQQTPVAMTPEMIAGNMDLDIEVELIGNRLARRAEALQALTVGSKVPGTNMGKLWEDYLKTQDKYNFEEYYTPPQPPPPEPPKVSVSLRGELGGVQSASIYGTIPGVNPKFADPIMTMEGRQMMRGELPENDEKEEKEMSQLERQSNILGSMADREDRREERKEKKNESNK